jgi:CRP/FNR family cyclic AMP-dependent transcriptional regulator
VQTELASLFKDLLLSDPDVTCLSTLRRPTSLFAQGEKAEAIYWIEEGLFKLTRTNPEGGRLILGVCGPGALIGEEALSGGTGVYHSEAEALTPSTVYKIPWASVERQISVHPELATAFLQFFLDLRLHFAYKVELLCLHGVENRVLYYLGELAKLVKPTEDEIGHALPMTQLELADLVGATRETISTTLKQLERRGLVKLSRRLLTVYLTPGKATFAATPNGGA